MRALDRCAACYAAFHKGDAVVVAVFHGIEIVGICAACWDRIHVVDRPAQHAWRRA